MEHTARLRPGITAFLCASIACLAAGDSRAETFADAFNRPDSSTVGNDWLDASGNVNNFSIRNNELTYEAASPLAGIYRPFSHDTTTILARLKEKSGIGGCCRYTTGVFFRNNGSLHSGYGVTFIRSDGVINNSQVRLYDNDQLLETVFSTFQYGSELKIAVTLNPDGSVSGNVTEPAPSVNRFDFVFGPRAVASSGPNVLITDEGSALPLKMRLDDLVIYTDAPAAPVTIGPGSFAIPGQQVSGVTAELAWLPTPRTQSYIVQLHDLNFDTVQTVGPVIDPGVTVSLDVGTYYAWSVRSCIDAAPGGDPVCPNSSQRRYFFQGFMPFGLLPPRPPPPLPSIPTNLVIVTHGYAAQTAGWPNDLVAVICQKLGTAAQQQWQGPSAPASPFFDRGCTSGSWGVFSFDWSEYAAPNDFSTGEPIFRGPPGAHAAARNLGARQGRKIAEREFAYIHLVAHSAGSRLVESLAKAYRARWPSTAIHMTLLDAYCPFTPIQSCDYGTSATYAEHYVDSRDLVMTGLETSTNQQLARAWNIDVTGLDNVLFYLGVLGNTLGRHAFPYRIYLQSAGVPAADLGDQFSASALLGEFTVGSTRLGAHQAAWDGLGVDSPSQWTIARALEHRSRIGTRCRVTASSDRSDPCPVLGAQPSPPVFQVTTPAVTSVLPTSCAATAVQGGNWFLRANLNTCQSSRGQGATPEPSVFLAQFTLQEPVDRLQFDLQFTSQQNGQLQVFVDNALVYIDSAEATTDGSRVPIAIELQRLDAGDHQLRILLFSLDAAAASAELTNLRLDVTSNAPIFQDGFEAPTSPRLQ